MTKAELIEEISKAAECTKADAERTLTAFFLIWDAYAINRGHWYFDKNQILGIFGPFGIPLEEFLFFLIVPLAALLTIEAVRTVKKHWEVGDES